MNKDITGCCALSFTTGGWKTGNDSKTHSNILYPTKNVSP